MARGRGNTTDKVDRDLLHQYLYKNSDRHHMMTISPSELADALGISVFHMSRILKEMKETGRLRVVGKRVEVVDPDLYMWSATNTNNPRGG